MREITKFRRTKPPQERRDELMNSAQRLFLQNGLDLTSIEQITDGANVAKGTFYLHFASKDEVLLALRDRFVRALLEDLKQAVARCPEDDWRGKLAAWAQAGVTYCLEEEAIHDLVFREYQLPSPKEQSENTVILHLAGLLEAGTAAGAWHVDDHRFTAIFLFHGLHGVVHDALAKEKRVARNLLVAKLQQTCFRAVGSPSALPGEKDRSVSAAKTQGREAAHRRRSGKLGTDQ
jgi:AcrR family transcriptional regulator